MSFIIVFRIQICNILVKAGSFIPKRNICFVSHYYNFLEKTQFIYTGCHRSEKKNLTEFHFESGKLHPYSQSKPVPFQTVSVWYWLKNNRRNRSGRGTGLLYSQGLSSSHPALLQGTLERRLTLTFSRKVREN